MSTETKRARGKAAGAVEFTKRRHWRQNFSADHEYVWIKAATLAGKQVAAGEKVDKSKLAPGRLRALWESGRIRIAGWSPPDTRRDFMTNAELEQRRAREAEEAAGGAAAVENAPAEGEGETVEGEAEPAAGETVEQAEPPAATGSEAIGEQ